MLDSIFGEDEIPNYKVYEAAHEVVADYMKKKNCKIDLVAVELGTTTGVLYRQLNPKDMLMPLSIDRIIAITRLTSDNRILQEIAKEFDMVLVKKASRSVKISDLGLLVDIVNIENNDVFKEVKISIADDVITREEQLKILKEINEEQSKMEELRQTVIKCSVKEE